MAQASPDKSAPCSEDQVPRHQAELIQLELAAPAETGVRERRDAAENRAKLLQVAGDLIRKDGPCGLTMDALAAAAGVGKGTIFRRFGSRAGLMMALLDHDEAKFQDSYLMGPPPLGPGASPQKRLIAFGRALINHYETHSELILEAGTSAERFQHSVWQATVLHVSVLLQQAAEESEAENSATTRHGTELLAQQLISALDPALVTYQRRTLNIPSEQISESWVRLAGAAARA